MPASSLSGGIEQMMFLNLTVASLSVGMASVIHANEESSPRSGHSIGMEVYPTGRDYIELKTGEVFCDPRYLTLRGKDRESISATLSVLPANADKDYDHSAMRYYKATVDDLDGHPSSIHFSCYLPPGDFADLLADIRLGITPSSVTVEVDENAVDPTAALTYGWEPDGSGKKWNNDKAASGKQAIKIDRLSLTSEELQGGYDEEAGRPTAPKLASNFALTKQTRELKTGLDLIQNDIRYYGRIVSIAVITIAVMILYWVLHMR
jgi:hypothetical protein